jgi:hypothetical protein
MPPGSTRVKVSHTTTHGGTTDLRDVPENIHGAKANTSCGACQ